MRCRAIRRPPLSQTAAVILMFSSWAFAKAPRRTRLASSSVKAIAVPQLVLLNSPRAPIIAHRHRRSPFHGRHSANAPFPHRLHHKEGRGLARRLSQMLAAAVRPGAPPGALSRPRLVEFGAVIFRPHGA